MADFDEVHRKSMDRAAATLRHRGECFTIALIEPARIRPQPEPVTTETVSVVHFKACDDGIIRPTNESLRIIADWKKRHATTHINAFKAWLP